MATAPSPRIDPPYRRYTPHPLHAILLAFPVALFSSALISDITYLNSAEMQWSNFSAWLITGGLIFGAPVLLWSAISLVRGRKQANRTPALAYFLLILVMWTAGFVNAFKHSQDAWSSVGTTGVILSVLSTLASIAAAWLLHAAKEPRA